METNNKISNKLTISIYNDLASPAMKQVGLSAESLLKFAALPFKFLGLTAEQLEKKYYTFIESAINRVPEHKLTTPKNSIVAPLLDYAKYSFADEPGNDLLQEMFSKLLSSSINQDYSNQIRKSFVEVMRFLSGGEARLLQWCYNAVEENVTGKQFVGTIASFVAFDSKGIVIEIPATTPGTFPYLNFPVEESLELLSSLGLIKYSKYSAPGYYFFRDLIRLQKNGKVNLEIPEIFIDAILKAKDRYLNKEIGEYDDDDLSYLFESEFPQLFNMLSQQDKISVEQAVDLFIMRYHIYTTKYGSQFLNFCIG